MDKPKLVRDWEGGYVKSDHEIRNGNGRMPAGTIYKITSTGITAHFESTACNCCGFQFRFTDKGRYKFDGMEWLGYESPVNSTEIK